MSKIRKLIDIDNNDDDTLYEVRVAAHKPHSLANTVDVLLGAVHATQGLTEPTEQDYQAWELGKYTDEQIIAEYNKRVPF